MQFFTILAFAAVGVLASPNYGGGKSPKPSPKPAPPPPPSPPPPPPSAPSCGGDQAVCCTGSYTAEGEVVDNCITYTPGAGVCQVQSNVYCCYTCEEPIGSCVGCVHYY